MFMIKQLYLWNTENGQPTPMITGIPTGTARGFIPGAHPGRVRDPCSIKRGGIPSSIIHLLPIHPFFPRSEALLPAATRVLQSTIVAAGPPTRYQNPPDSGPWRRFFGDPIHISALVKADRQSRYLKRSIFLVGLLLQLKS
jgi:hypothetical protein